MDRGAKYHESDSGFGEDAVFSCFKEYNLFIFCSYEI